MKRKAFAIGAGLVLSASFAAPALAEYRCYGSNNTIGVCVDPQGETLLEDCVYTGPSDGCTDVLVPGPSYYCFGRSGSLCDVNILEPQQ